MPIIDIFPDSHLFFASSNEIDNIVRPLKDAFGLTSFVYQYNFHDGTEIRLSNQPKWLKHFCRNQWFEVSSFEKHPSHYQSGIAIWSHLNHHNKILNEANSFNIANGITLIEKQHDGCEFFFLGTSPDHHHFPNLLINNMEFLKRFIVYFHQIAGPLIKKAKSQRFFIPNKYNRVMISNEALQYTLTKKLPNILMTFKKIHIDSDTTLTAKELICAKLLVSGHTTRTIAEQLSLSPRTVETHIQNMKNKLNCSSKTELVNKLFQLNINML